MARLNETSKDAHDQGAQNDTQTIPAESHLEYGDFENDDDLTEAEKATIRQKLATRKRQVTFGRGDGQGNSEDEGNDVNAAERRRQSCRQSLKKAVKPADKTSIELGYDDDTDDMYLRFYGIHDNDEREILADMRNVDDFTACIAEHAESVFGHLADLLSQIAEQAEQLDQAHNEARVQQEAADARVERAQTQARAAAADELAQVTQKCNRMITTKNSYASRLAVLEDELAASRESNVKLYSQISDLYNERSKNRPLARSAVSDNLTATGAKLKDIDIFRGDSTDKEDYKYWRRSARNFLNKTTIHTTVQDQLDYLIDHLRGPAAAQVEYRAAPGARNAYVTAEEVLTELDRIFDTVDKVTEASAALHDSGSGGLKQRDNESFNTWVARFTSTVAPLNLGDNEMIQHAIRLMKFGRNAGLQFRHGDTWEAFAQNCRTQQQLSRLTQSSGNNGTANVSGKKHRPTDADVPAACKSGSIVPASRVPALKATFTNAALQATVVDATDESEN
ncbi:KfrA-N domain containing protein [Pyrenophora tritici-repentis]|uniref:KfrA-N domain containing protein n=1 Tax=Pyrenophora tritici-repentis TaxID=45151 RepID=A0A834RNA3_9PLEO|nr:KfrA-N domain containing protein [Pyrenophora tritici-repentis]